MQYLTQLIIYPFILVFLFVFALLINNIGLLPPSLFFRPLLVSWLVTAIGLWVVYRITKDKHRAGFLLTLGLVCFLTYNYFLDSLTGLISTQGNRAFTYVLSALWILLFLGLGHRSVWSKLSRPILLTFLLNLVLLLSLLYPILQLTQFALNEDGQMQEKMHLTFHSEQPGKLTANQSPDIYVIVLDAYGRSDVLKELYHIDNLAFIDGLRQRGFYVAEQSHSNYMQTPLAFSGLLNFQYHGEWRIPENHSLYASFVRLPVLENQVMQLLRDLDYSIVAFESGFELTELPNADYYDSGLINLNPIEEFILGSTPLRLITEFIDTKLPISNYQTHRTRLKNTLEGLISAHTIPGRKLIIAHLLLPHPPFVYDRNGGLVNPNRPYSIFDGDDYPGSVEEYYLGYREQVLYTSNAILDVIDQILNESESPPVIILQGDHGPGMFHNWDGIENSCLFERSSILNALYLPGVDKNLLYPTLSPVNSFRIIFNSYFGTDLELLPDRTYYSSWRMMEEMADVSDIRDSRNNCINLEPNKAVDILQIDSAENE